VGGGCFSFVGFGVGVKVGKGNGVEVGVGVSVGVSVGVGVKVAVGVGVIVSVGVKDGVGVAVLDGVGVGVASNSAVSVNASAATDEGETSSVGVIVPELKGKMANAELTHNRMAINPIPNHHIQKRARRLSFLGGSIGISMGVAASASPRPIWLKEASKPGSKTTVDTGDFDGFNLSSSSGKGSVETPSRSACEREEIFTGETRTGERSPFESETPTA